MFATAHLLKSSETYVDALWSLFSLFLELTLPRAQSVKETNVKVSLYLIAAATPRTSCVCFCFPHTIIHGLAAFVLLDAYISISFFEVLYQKYYPKCVKQVSSFLEVLII